MWVSKKEFNALREKVERLERDRSNYEFIVYRDLSESERQLYSYSTWIGNIANTKIHVKTVIDAILEKLGMRLQYVAGQPERAAVVKK